MLSLQYIFTTYCSGARIELIHAYTNEQKFGQVFKQCAYWEEEWDTLLFQRLVNVFPSCAGLAYEVTVILCVALGQGKSYAIIHLFYMHRVSRESCSCRINRYKCSQTDTTTSHVNRCVDIFKSETLTPEKWPSRLVAPL